MFEASENKLLMGRFRLKNRDMKRNQEVLFGRHVALMKET
jgi:hypothetical protein